MIPEKRLIIIGCDDTATLSAILNSLNRISAFSPDIVSVSRTPDLISISKATNPDLIMLCFRNNEIILRDFDVFAQKTETPIICLTGKRESETLGWNTNCIVFTFPLEHIANEQFLGSRLNSIFMLRNKPSKELAVSTFAAAAAQNHQQENNRNLSRYVMELDRKVEVLQKVKDRIAHLYPSVADPVKAELTSIANSIRLAANDNKLWADFKLYFEQSNPGFLLNLSQKFPGLTPIDLKYCCYLVMNMTNDDIRNLLGINQESVRTHKYRLKKKMLLSKEQDLTGYLRSVG